MPPLHSSYHGLGCEKHARYVSHRVEGLGPLPAFPLDLGSLPTLLPAAGQERPADETAGERGKAYGACRRARRSTLREPRNAVWQGLRVASGRIRTRVRMRPEGD